MSAGMPIPANGAGPGGAAGPGAATAQAVTNRLSPDGPRPTRTQIGQLLVVLYRYVTQLAPSHPGLEPVVSVLEDAAVSFRSQDDQGAMDKATVAYSSIIQVRRLDPSLPLP